ncbi:restriction endonuclease subunit S [Chromohalobacter canadensis]|uniref:Restriction endonuclease subunit S n=1 Tax=Chromohalobacter canadensis TaxID=141389 RepID=A0ABZ0Y9V4_9GAMM|nr:restriction endonuclease subunit S [Chromohalobacter canadensis]MCK0767804.1 restriction endonuclease subunit S [Chromohalobacter canadensis]WQH08374.1 restriction endonuclease subunit S [Chromohalobacter canadensis]
MSFPKYPEHKDSGVEWLGEVPAHWKLGSFRYLIKSLSNGTIANQVDQEDGSVAVSRIETISKGEVDFSKVGHVRPNEVDKRFLLKAGDILFSHINSLPMIGNAAVYMGGKPLLHGMNLLRIQPEESVVSSWVAYWLKSKVIRQEVESRAKPAINQASISTGSVKSLPALIPPESEQRGITSFLDHETARIDALVEEQQHLISLLKEKRQAVISHAVTKGLDPDVTMKDSGVEWLGEVPAHWDVVAIKWLSAVQRGASPRPIDDPAYFDENGEYGWVRIADVTASSGQLESTMQTLSKLGSSLSVKLQPGSLFVSIAGTVGKPCITSIKACIHDGFVYFPELTINPNFLYQIFESGLCYLGLGKMGTQLNLNTDTVGGIKVAVPPHNEIEKILQTLEHDLGNIDTMSRQAEEIVALMQERRSALISAAVTGKIDVRGWMPPADAAPAHQDARMEAV